MDFLETLTNLQQSSASAYHVFLLNYKKDANTVHVFFEGYEDSSFYNNFIIDFLDDKTQLEVYTCKGKPKVLALHSDVMEKLPLTQTALFFVDKDFSDLLGETHPDCQNIYITDFYSIENYLVSSTMFVRVWTDFFRFTKKAPRVDIFESIFKKQLGYFYKLILPIMAWNVYLRRKNKKPILNNLKLNEIFHFNDDLMLIEKSINRSYLDKKCRVTTTDECEMEINLIVEELKKLDPKLYVRGKFELWFFVKFIAKLSEFLKKKMSLVDGNLKVSPELSESNAIALLGPRLKPIPKSLGKFLSHNLLGSALLLTDCGTF